MYFQILQFDTSENAKKRAQFILNTYIFSIVKKQPLTSTNKFAYNFPFINKLITKIDDKMIEKNEGKKLLKEFQTICVPLSHKYCQSYLYANINI